MSRSATRFMDEITKRNEIIDELIAALETAFNTVQCDSIIIEGPDKGKDHIWHSMATKAIARAKDL